MSNIAVIGDKYSIIPFALIGAKTFEVESSEEVIKVLRDIIKEEDIGLVLITQNMMQSVQGELEEIMKNRSKPLISMIPSAFTESKPINVRKLIMEALGFG
jgi:V/A-type H+-transporting ATPase subunit F